MRKVAVGLIVLLWLVFTTTFGIAATSTAKTQTDLTIAAWIAMSITSGGVVSFGEITAPGVYSGSPDTVLTIISTKSWSISHTIVWDDPSVVLPSGANKDTKTTLAGALNVSYTASSGSRGLSTVTVSYELDLSDQNLWRYLPAGDYVLVVQFTATTE